MKELVKVEITDEVTIEVQPNETHEWLLSSKDVAECYGVTAQAIRMAKSRYSDELIEGKHFTTVTFCDSGKPPVKTTMWTKKGVVRLGFLIRTPLAKQFRDWAEDFIINNSEPKQETKPALPQTYLEALEELVAKEKMLLEMKPKVELYDDLTHQDEDTTNFMTLNEVAKELGYKPRAEFNPLNSQPLTYGGERKIRVSIVIF
jgi:prophage antirepressor-like protein